MRTLLVFLLSLGACLGTNLVSVTGPQDYPLALLPSHAAAVAFTLSGPVSNFQFSAPIDCSGCQGVAYLSSGLDVGFDSSMLLAASAILDNSTPQLSGLSLSAGTYFVTLSNESGSLIWYGTTQGTTSAPGGSADAYFHTTNAAALAPGSRFDVFTAAQLEYTVADNPVPEPASAWLLAPAVLVLAASRRKQKFPPGKR